jgi:hypothetical protein
MKVDNFDKVRSLMHFELDGDMYFVEVLQRGKDVGSTGERLVRDYHIHSLKQFDELRPEITGLCDSYKARAYIRLNQRNVEDANIYAQIEMLKEQLTRNQTVRKAIKTGNTNTILKAKMNKIRSATKIYGSVLGSYSSEPRETVKWIIDIDPERVNPEIPGMDTIENVADTWSAFIKEKCHPYGVEKELCRIPSKSGLHLITRSFNIKEFSDVFGTDTNGDSFVKADGITNLYIPDFDDAEPAPEPAVAKRGLLGRILRLFSRK